MDPHLTGTPGNDLQFDRVESSAADAAAGSAGIQCASCGAKIETAYFNIGTDPFCVRCKGTIQRQIQPERSMGAFIRALMVGTVAAIAGAVVYYGVIAITNLEIGIVAILIGYMVGWGVRKGASGRGGRRFQVLAVALTYFSVGLAYFPLAMKSVADKDKPSAAQTDSTQANSTKAATPTVVTAEPATPVDPSAPTKAPNIPLFIAMVIGLTFALPVLMVIGSMPSGLISAIIILIGMRQAWAHTGVPNIQITGPFRVGSSTPRAST